MIGFIPIDCTSNYNKNIKIRSNQTLVLIDDDELVHQTWEMMAKQNQQTLHSYYDVDSFIKDCEKFAKDIIIFIDSYLKFDLKGEVESKRIYDLGFTNIHLASGENLNRLPPWIVSQSGKSYPQMFYYK